MIKQKDEKVNKQKSKIEDLVKGMLQLKDDWNQMEIQRKIQKQKQQTYDNEGNN